MQSTSPGSAAAASGRAAGRAPGSAPPRTSTPDRPGTTQAAEAPAPAVPQLVIPAANVTVVRTAAELQRAALDGARDIEIRAHLDLRSLKLAANPAIHGQETAVNRKRLALLYASPPLRSIRVCPSTISGVASVEISISMWPPSAFFIVSVHQ